MRIQKTLTLVLACVMGLSAYFLPAHAETTLFPANSFGVAGPIPTPPNIGDLVGEPVAGTAVTFDPGDLGFLMFGDDISGVVAGTSALNLQFDIVSAVPSGSGDLYVSVILGNIGPTGAGGGLAFTIAPTTGLTNLNGAPSIFEFTQVPGTGIFSVPTDTFASGCSTIGGCNTIVIGTSGFGATSTGGAIDGGTLTFAAVVAASPEPTSWALMILGFFGVAWRLKLQRAHGLTGSSSFKALTPHLAA